MAEQRWYHKVIYYVVIGALKLYFALVMPITLHGDTAQLRREGGAIFYSNHTSAYDPLVLMLSLRPRTCYLMAKSTLFEKNALLADLFRGVGAIAVQRGESDLAALKKVLGVLNKGQYFVIFPEGTRNRGDRHTLLPFMNGVGLIALRSHVPVVPVYLDAGGYRWFHRVHVYVGQPLDFEAVLSAHGGRVNRDTLSQATEFMRKELEKLQN